MSHAPQIIERFGGSRKMAAALTVPEADKRFAPTTVQSWKDSGFIPAQHQNWVLQRSRELGIGLEPNDFFDVPSSGEAA